MNSSSGCAESVPRGVQAAVRDPDPVCILENELLYGVTFPVSEAALDADFILPYKAKVMREGTDVTLIAFSKMVRFLVHRVSESRAAGIAFPLPRFHCGFCSHAQHPAERI